MNQILATKLIKKSKIVFKIQFIISILAVGGLIIYLYLDYHKSENLEYLSKTINQNVGLSSMYDIEKQQIETSPYLGKLYIEKINLEYTIFKEFNDELLKIAPCKFYGVNIGEKGNICIAGHNYNDDRFFGRLNELEIKDKIKLVDLLGNEYEYTIFDIFETTEDDIYSVTKNTKDYELTLLTCNNANKKRIIIKAYHF